jgi:large subunit ribosomal protein L17
MRHSLAGRQFGRDSSHRQAMYRNLVTDLLKHEKIVTTEAKAKEVRGMAEKVITLGKKSDAETIFRTGAAVQGTPGRLYTDC